MGQRNAIREAFAELRLEAKAKQASKLAEIREELIAAGCNSAAKQAAALGVCRSTAWALLNRDNRVGPSATLIRRILCSPKLPPAARRKVEEYVEGRISGLFGHSDVRSRWFRDQIRTATQQATKPEQNHGRAADP
jgi:hypothetical protein